MNTTKATHAQHVEYRKVSLQHSFVYPHRILTIHRRTDWAEEEDEDSLALPAPSITKNKDGSETIVTYSIREDGKKVKTTRRIKKTVVKQVVNPRVAERKQWAKFGNEAGKPSGPQTDTTSVAENIVFRPMAGWKAGNAADDKNLAEKEKKNPLKDAKIKCRICSGDHWTTKCPYKDTMAPEGEAGGIGAEKAPVDDMAEGKLGGGGGGYVPPHLRKGGAGAGERMGGKYERDDLATLRVTNVSWAQTHLLKYKFEANIDFRSRNLQKSKISERCSQDGVTSQESSSQRTGRPAEQRVSHLSVTLIGQMLRRLARRWMATVSIILSCVLSSLRSQPSSGLCKHDMAFLGSLYMRIEDGG